MIVLKQHTLSFFWRSIMLMLPVVLAGCVTAPPAQLQASLPKKWHVPEQAATQSAAVISAQDVDPDMPHGGSVAQLLNWWKAWNDPLLTDLIAAAQTHSPTLASAAATIAQARMGATNATAAMLPTLNAQASMSRSTMSQIPFVGTITNNQTGSGQLQWEIDLFGGLNHSRRAANARLNAAQAMWHDARVSLAADVANQYFALRDCQRRLVILQLDAMSQQDVARLTGHLERAGFAASSTLAMAEAGAAQVLAQRTQLQARCTAAIKGLSALTAMDEDLLQERLRQSVNTQPPALTVDAVPAQVLAQRPDVYSAAQALAGASADVGYAKAQRLPHLTFSGSISRTLIASSLPGLEETRLTLWSIGPLGLSVPLFDGGRLAALSHSSKVQYEAAALQYYAVLRNAVRDVETALVDLHSAQQRSLNTQLATKGFEKAFQAANAKYRVGMGSMLELEDARRNLNAAMQNQSALQQQLEAAWVAVYRALGGGWTLATNITDADHALIRAGTSARNANTKTGAVKAATDEPSSSVMKSDAP